MKEVKLFKVSFIENTETESPQGNNFLSEFLVIAESAADAIRKISDLPDIDYFYEETKHDVKISYESVVYE